MNHVRSPLLWFGDDALGWLIVFPTGSRSSFVRFGVFCPLSRSPPPPAFGLDPVLVVAFFDGRPLFLLTTMGGTVHRANPFIVVVVVVVQLLLFVSLRRDSLPSRWSRSIDRSINSRANRMDLKEMLTWHSDAFSRSTFSLFKKRPSRLLDQQRQNVKKSSFENHDIYTPRAGRGDDLLLRRRPFYTKGKKARAFCVQKSFPQNPSFLLLEKNTF